MSEKTTEDLIRQNRRYRETLIILSCAIFGFLAGVTFDRFIQGHVLQQSARLGGIVIDNTPYTIQRMTGASTLQAGSFASAASPASGMKEKK